MERGLVGASWSFPLNPVIFAGKNICGSVFSGIADETVHGDFVRLFKKDDVFACFWLCWVFIAGWALLRLQLGSALPGGGRASHWVASLAVGHRLWVRGLRSLRLPGPGAQAVSL